jgi:hypothetical protein
MLLAIIALHLPYSNDAGRFDCVGFGAGKVVFGAVTVTSTSFWATTVALGCV